MKAVILAAGRSTRTFPLTVNRPKPLLKVANKTVIEHTLSQLRGIVDEAIIVIGHEGSRISDYLGSAFADIQLTFIEQSQQTGTAHALLAAEKLLDDKFIVLMGDDIYSRDAIAAAVKHDLCISGRKVKDIAMFGEIVADGSRLIDLKEKPAAPTTGIANTGLYVLDRKIFPVIEKLDKSSRGEYELTDAVKSLAKQEKIVVETADSWIPITYPWSLLEANEELLNNIEGDVASAVEENVTIKGKVVVGKNTLLRSGTYIEGPVIIGENCDIGPNCYIRASTSIGDNCRIGNAVEIKNSIVMDNSHVAHLSYVGDSVIGENVNLGAGFIVANLRHDNEEVRSRVSGQLTGTATRKFGTAIGDNVKTGIRTSVYPGRKIWPDKTTLPGEVVKEDII
ncbi:NTP transferase domain-containing protein [Candidatus Woesearchaeota archaeon]|nr:NTP transferase domain-containing protein [Candidatus Woesearchaeota archaeon]